MDFTQHEWAICGTLIVAPDAVHQLFDARVHPEMFQEEHPRRFITLFRQIYSETGTPPSLQVVAREMQRGRSQAEIEEIRLALVRMRNSADRPENLRHHIDELRARYEERFLINLLGRALQRLGKNPSRKQVEEVRIYITESIYSFASAHGTGSDDMMLLRDVLLEGFREIIERRENPEMRNPQVVPTGFRCLDEKYLSGGFRLGQVALIAGRPSHGKTQLGAKIGLNAARAGHPGVFVSLEMTRAQLRQRLFANLARVSLDKLLREDLTNEEIRRLWIAATEGCMLRNPDGTLVTDERGEPVPIPFYIVDKPALKLSELMHLLRMAKREHRITWAVVDYVQLIHLDSGRAPSKEHEFSLISAGLRLIARALNIVLIGLIQVNRESENRQDKQPRMSDLRNSGSWEQDAGYILTIMRPMVYDRDTDRPDDLDVSIEKNRFGTVGLETLDWNGPMQDITDKPEPRRSAA